LSFLSPFMLLGLAAAAVPLVIHLFNRFRPKVISWGAMALLERVMLARSRRIRLEDVVMLLLRTLAIVLLVLAMARPVITTHGAGWLDTRPGAVIAVDASMSMMHRTAATTRFEAALDRARQILETLEPGDPVTLVLLGAEPRLLQRNVGYDPARFAEALEEAEPRAERLNLESALEQLRRMTGEMRVPSPECYLITDGQANTWGELGAAAAANARAIAEEATLHLVPVAAPHAEHLAVTDLAHVSGPLRRGATARYRVAVSNPGAEARTNVAVRLEVGQTTTDRRTLDRLEAGQTRRLSMFARFEEAASAQVQAVIDAGGDSLQIDNRRYAVAEIRERVRVLCLTGGRPPDRHGRDPDAAFLETALTSGAAAGQEAIEVKVAGHRRFELAAGLDGYDLLILANVPELAPRSVEAVHAFVRRGGALVVFAGQTMVPAQMNTQMRHRGEPLLPGELGEAVGREGADADPWALTIAEASHPLARALGALPEALLAQVRIERYLPVTPSREARVILRAGPDGDPLLVERPLGEGRVLLFASTANRQWNNLPLHPAYPVLLGEMVTQLTRRPWEQALTVGAPAVLWLPADRRREGATLSDPAGEQGVVPLVAESGAHRAELPAPVRPGFHRFESDVEAFTLAANPPARESDVSTLPREALARTWAGASGGEARVLATGAVMAEAIRETRIGTELWRPLLILAALLFVAESILAGRFSRTVRLERSGPASSGRAGRPPAGVEGGAQG